MDWPVSTLIGASVLAFFVGILTGVFGVGGGFLMTPGLMILLSVPGPIAVGTGLAAILANSSLGVYKRRGTSTVDGHLAMTMSVGSVVGVVAGSFLLEAIQGIQPVMLKGAKRDPVELLLLSLFAVLLIWMAIYIAHDCRHTKRGGVERPAPLLRRVPVPPTKSYHTVVDHELSVPMLIVLGLVIGVLTGLLGIGGGVVLLPILIYWVGQDPKQAAGTSLVMVLIASFVGVVHKGLTGHISLSLWLVMMVGGLIGTRLGTMIGLGVAGEKLKTWFLVVVLLAVGMVGSKLCAMLLG